MNDLDELYQSLILDHNRRPRNCHKLDGADRQADGYNPLCGDKITVYLNVENGVVQDVSFEGTGCAISTASASLMTDSIRGKTLTEAKALFEKFHGLVTGENTDTNDGPELGKLEAFSGVCRFPARVKCATLAWHTVKAALDGASETISTE